MPYLEAPSPLGFNPVRLQAGGGPGQSVAAANTCLPTARAIIATLQATPWHVGGQVFNIDHSNLRVCKAATTLGWVPQWTMAQAALQITHQLQDGSLSDGPRTYTTAWYRRLLAEGHGLQGAQIAA